MNRIQELNGKYQVLISGNTEDFLGRLSKFSVSNAYLEEFDTLEKAQIRSFQLPDLNWYKIINYHKYEYKRIEKDIKNVIKNELNSLTFIFESNLKSPQELKDIVFRRLNHYKNDFVLDSNINDIITYNISNPWSKNIITLIEKLKKVQY